MDLHCRSFVETRTPLFAALTSPSLIKYNNNNINNNENNNNNNNNNENN